MFQKTKLPVGGRKESCSDACVLQDQSVQERLNSITQKAINNQQAVNAKQVVTQELLNERVKVPQEPIYLANSMHFGTVSARANHPDVKIAIYSAALERKKAGLPIL